MRAGTWAALGWNHHFAASKCVSRRRWFAAVARNERNPTSLHRLAVDQNTSLDRNTLVSSHQPPVPQPVSKKPWPSAGGGVTERKADTMPALAEYVKLSRDASLQQRLVECQ